MLGSGLNYVEHYLLKVSKLQGSKRVIHDLLIAFDLDGDTGTVFEVNDVQRAKVLIHDSVTRPIEVGVERFQMHAVFNG
jgi:hypothetical protein